jgi:hypothetical protein
VSLRTQIHSAFDEVAPPTFGLPERVVKTVLTESPSRRRREKLILRMRVPLSLVAVFVLIALVAGILIGGRLIQDWNSFHNAAPAGDSYQSEVAQLEARPLVLPTPASNIYCNSGPYHSDGGFGTGPVYGIGGGTSTSNWGTYFHNGAYAETRIAGPILVRARDLFTLQSVIFVGQYAAGPVVGTDTVDGQSYEQHLELLLDESSSSKQNKTHKFDWPFIAGVPNAWSGSTGWQIDGVGFSEVFVAC